ncbi:MAG: sugar ABC transporter ATP-binding protein [Eubacteriales bacterium]|nr:sugar ABC transporter ATP-binding protein [Eubacteriales bacterium]
MSNAILTVQNVIKRFSGTVALKGVDMELYPNEILALAGENGAGKSTLMKILSGIYPHGDYEGRLLLGGEPCRFQGPADSEDAGIAMIYQELNLELDLTVAENILLGRYPRTKLGLIDWKRVHTEARTALDMLGVDIDTRLTVRNLSPSLQQLVSIARALYRKPRILILDEPTSVLTEKEAGSLMDILRGLRDKGISCIYISHKLDEIFALCDRTVVFRDGEKISEHKKSDGYDSARVIEDMIGRRLDAMYPVRKASIGQEVLRVEHFRVAHPFAYGKTIIDDVSFSLHRGEILGLSGLVGAGRSELCSAIFGAMPKLCGKLYLGGKEVNITEPSQAIKLGLGFLSEDRKKNGFIWSMSIRENMTLVALRDMMKGLFVDQKKELQLAEEFFGKLRVKAPSLDTQITNLSGGNQQKVILAKWLMSETKILMLDEPTRGIDVGTKSEIYSLMQELTDMGISIIMISSEMPELLAMCDRLVVLGKGIVQREMVRGEADEVSLMRAASCT